MNLLIDMPRTTTWSTFVLFALIALLSLFEAFLPLQQRTGGSTRIKTNLGLIVATFLLNFGLSASVVGIAACIEREGWGLLPPVGLPLWAVALIGILSLDLSGWVSHFLMHKLPWLWRVHRVHHSDRHVDVTTSFRQHPLEGLLRFLFTVIPAFALGLPPALVAFYRLLSGINAVLEHMNLRLWTPLDRALRLVVVTPDMHKVHHSCDQVETDTNYGNLFSVFDRLFRTYTSPSKVTHIRYGLDDFDGRQTAVQLLRSPFIDAGR
jgi:sterol desaturase/sphingolipid hydroxylase (fatty acid hydroxylase superfamily)